MSFQFTTRRMMVWFVVAAILFWIVSRANDARQEATESACRGHLHQFRLVFELYREAHGSYPPLYTVDSNGKPMHSWRVLILPYIQEHQLYNAYNFNEPWNGPNNIKLMNQKPAYFQCPSQSVSNTTAYLAVSSSSDPTKFNDSGKNPIIFVELHSKEVNWLEPTDISIDELNKIIAAGNFSKHHLHPGSLRGIRDYPKSKRPYVFKDIYDDSDLED